MTRMKAATHSLHERRIESHRVNDEGSFPSISTVLQSAVVNAWAFAASYSILHYAMAGSLARSNTETIAALASAATLRNAEDRVAAALPGSSDICEGTSVAELMASDRRRIECRALGDDFVNNLALPLRKDLIMVASVVC